MPPTALSFRWIEKRQAHWTRLEALLMQARAGVSALSHHELQELALLYRQTAADLSAARDHAANAQLAGYLNQLLGRAHNVIYVAPPARARGVVTFYTRTFPRVFRETWRYTAAAIGLFAIGVITAIAVCAEHPGFQRFVLGADMIDTIERHEMWTHSIVAIKPLASSAILTNNIGVALTAGAMGVLAGLGTMYIMLFNGLMIGVIGSACHAAGMSLALWSFVAPHGALELPAIFIAGGAGLLLGRAIVAPGLQTRREALAESGALSIKLLLGLVPLLIVAGIIEAFISPTDVVPAIKFLIGAALFVMLLIYLTAFRADRVP
jgi:uncharacterized membrane protein SpoIIM required for sporulation